MTHLHVWHGIQYVTWRVTWLYMCDMAFICVTWRVTWLIYMSDMVHCCAMSHINETWVTYQWAMSHAKHSRLRYAQVMSHMCMRHGARINALCRKCETFKAEVRTIHVDQQNESWGMYQWDMSYMWVSHICTVTHANEYCHRCDWVMSHTWMSHGTLISETYHPCKWVIYAMSRMRTSTVTGVDESCHTHEWVMGHVQMRHATPVNESHLTYV